MKISSKSRLAIGALLALGIAASAQAWSAVPAPVSVGPWGPEVIDSQNGQFAGARARRLATARLETAKTNASFTFDVASLVICTGSDNWQLANRRDVGPSFPGNIIAQCPQSGSVTQIGGAVDVNPDGPF